MRLEGAIPFPMKDTAAPNWISALFFFTKPPMADIPLNATPFSRKILLYPIKFWPYFRTKPPLRTTSLNTAGKCDSDAIPFCEKDAALLTWIVTLFPHETTVGGYLPKCGWKARFHFTRKILLPPIQFWPIFLTKPPLVDIRLNAIPFSRNILLYSIEFWPYFLAKPQLVATPLNVDGRRDSIFQESYCFPQLDFGAIFYETAAGGYLPKFDFIFQERYCFTQVNFDHIFPRNHRWWQSP